jgi:hypothetical protein
MVPRSRLALPFRYASLLAGLALAAGSWPAAVNADPAGCGAHEDAFSCTAKLQTGPPTPGESTFINNVRGHIAGNDAQLLNIGRTICQQISGGVSSRYVVTEVATHAGTDSGSAGQVVDQATEDICPGAHINS